MKLLTLTFAMFLTFNSFAANLVSEASYSGEKDSFFGGDCSVVIQELESINGYGQQQSTIRIIVSSGDDRYEFDMNKDNYRGDVIEAISGSDFFSSRPTQLTMDVKEDGSPRSLLIKKEKIGSNKLLSCNNF